MASQNITALTNYAGGQAPADLVYVAKSPFGATDDRKSTLSDLFAYPTKNVTDKTQRWQAASSPSVSAASEGAMQFTGTVFQISQNGGAWTTIGNITTTGFTATRIPIASDANTLIDDDGLSYNTTTNILSVGTTGGGGVGLLGTTGFSNILASQAPAATLLTYWPNAAPTAGQALYAATVGAQVQLGYATVPLGSGSNTQVAVWGASNALAGSSALTFASGVVAISGTSNPGVTVTGTAATESGITINQSVSGAAADAFHSFQTPSTTMLFRLTTAGFTPSGLVKANQIDMLGATGTVEMLFRLADASTRFVYGVNNVEAASINATSTLGLVLGAASTLTGRVRLYNSAGTTYSQISSGNAGSSLNFIWPVVNPTAGQVLSASAPSGSDVTLSWTTPSGGSSLTATQVGFGSGANALTGSADFTYTDATGVLDLTKTLNSSVYYSVTNLSSGAAAQARLGTSANVSGTGLIAYSSGFTTSGLRTANSAVLDLDGTTSVILGQSAGSILFGLGTTQYASLSAAQFALTTLPSSGAGLSVSASTVTSGSLVSFSMTGTAAASNTKTALAISSSGANGTASQTVFGSTISVTNTGTTNTNVALRLTASGAATTNTALDVTNGQSTFADVISLTSTTAVNNKITQGAALNIGTTSTDGIVLQNTTAAAASAQQYSPRLRLTGQGWKTTATAASQAVDWIIENQPVQGAANPTTNLVISSQVNAGGYSGVFSLSSAGKITSNIGANLDWFSGQYAASEYVRLGFGSTGYGLFSGSVYSGSTGNGYAIGAALFAYTNTTMSIGTVSAAFATFSSAADTAPVLLLPSVGYTTKPSIRINQTSGTTALPFEVQLNAVRQFAVQPAGGLEFLSDTFVRRAAAATLALGAADAASPVAQTLSVQNVVAGTSNTAGVTWTFKGSASTGNAAGGNLVFQTTPAGGSGTSQNSYVTTLTITGAGLVGVGSSAPTAAQLEVTSQSSTRLAALFTAASGASATQRLLTFQTNTPTDLGGFTSGGVQVMTNLGTAPSASVTDACLSYVADAAAADANWFLRAENGAVTRLTNNIRTLDQDFNSTSTTQATITGSSTYSTFSFNVEASKVYAFRAILFLTTDTTGGFAIKFNGGTATAFYYINQSKIFYSGTSISASRVTSFSSTSIAGFGLTSYYVEIDGYISINAAGTLLLQFAQNSASGTSSVVQGSSFQLIQSNI